MGRSLRDHLVIHAARLESFEKIKQEVTEIARTRAALGGPAPMGLDVLKGKGNGKGKGKDKNLGSYESRLQYR